jgi:hypothetical protein
MSDSGLTATSGLYWRRSLLNGRRCVPVVLGLDGGRLRMRTATETVFDVPTTEVTARFTALTTMMLTVGGSRYAIVGIGSAISPRFTAEMLAELEQAQARAAGTYDGGAAPGTDLGVLGLTGAVADFAEMRRSIAPWRELFDRAGVTVER